MATVASVASTVVKSNLRLREWWISDPKYGGAVRLKDVVDFQATESENLGWFEPLGTDRSISISSGIMGAKIDCTLEFYTQQDFFAVRSLRRLKRTLLLRDPWGNKWYVRFNESFSWVVHPGAGPHRTVSCSFTEVRR